jgi:tetratricopeptide (TPR) repeat protein
VGALGGVAWDEARRRSLVAASRAVEAAPELPEALAARGKARLIEWDWQGARADVDRALEISPEDARALDGMGTYLGATGRYREAIAVLKRVLAKDPLDSRAWNQLGILHGFTGDFDRARDAFSRALEIDPKHGHARANSAYLLLLEGRFAEALAACEEAEVPDCVACAHYHLGHATQSQQALDALIAVSQKEDRVFEVALVYGCRGDRDETIEWLQRAYERHDRQLLAIKAFPEFRVVRDDPRYVELLRKMNLPLD